MRYRNLLVLLGACLLPVSILAQPVITSVDTSQLNSGKLIINGSGFQNGPDVNVFDTFESNSSAKAGDPIPLSSPDIGTWTITNGLDPLYDSLAHSGKFSMRAHTPGQVRAFWQKFPKGVQEAFVSYWVRLEDGARFPSRNNDPSQANYRGPGEFSEDSSWKFTWLLDTDTGLTSPNQCLPTHTGNGKFMLAGNDFNMFTQLGNSWWSWTSWMRISVWMRADPNNPTTNGDILFQVVSQEHGVYEDRNNRPIFDTDNPPVKQYQEFHIPGWMRATEDASASPRYDDIYLAIGANSIARVELADSATYAQARKIEIQPASSWSGGKITVDVNQGGFSSLGNVYLFVWDKDGNRNSTGFPLSAGNAAPLYPGNIS